MIINRETFKCVMVSGYVPQKGLGTRSTSAKNTKTKNLTTTEKHNNKVILGTGR